MNKVLQAHLALLIVNIIYAANYSIAKEVMPGYVQPFAFVLMRVMGAAVLFWMVGHCLCCYRFSQSTADKCAELPSILRKFILAAVSRLGNKDDSFRQFTF